MLSRLLQHCIHEVAMDGDEGTDTERLFSFVEAFCRALPQDMQPNLDAPYRAFLWRHLLMDSRIHAGIVRERAQERTGEQASGTKKPDAKRQSILAKGRASEPLLLTPTPIAYEPLDALVKKHGPDRLRVYVNAEHVRRTLTGSDAPFVSAAAYTALQLVFRARERGLTVVDIGAATQYDQKTVYYLVKVLVDRDLVAKFAAPEMGHVSNYVVGRPFLEQNPQWRAQQNALGTDTDPKQAVDLVGMPSWVDVDVIATQEEQRGDADDERGADERDESVLSLTLPPVMNPHEGEMLAFPMLTEEQSSVWLHSRQDLLSLRLLKMFAQSPSHMTPRRWLATRLGLRRVPTLRRGFLTFLNQRVSAGYLERVRVQLGSTTPLYLRATPLGLERQFTLDAGAEAAGESLSSVSASEQEPMIVLSVAAPLERQLLDHVDACGKGGCTMNELAQHFCFSSEVKRMVEQILSRQVSQGPPPYAPLSICAPFEQEGRERRIRYYTARGFAEKCADEGLSMSVALGYDVPSDGSVPNVPDSLPGECMFESADALCTAMQHVRTHTWGFFRDVCGPVPLRGTKRRAHVDPSTGRSKRGRPRKDEVRVKQETAASETTPSDSRAHVSGHRSDAHRPAAPEDAVDEGGASEPVATAHLEPAAPTTRERDAQAVPERPSSSAAAPARPKSEATNVVPIDPALCASEQQGLASSAAATTTPSKSARRLAPLSARASRASEARTNLSSFQRTTLLAHVLRHHGGAVDEVDIPRRTRECLDKTPMPGGDLSDRTTRAKTIQHAIKHGVVKVVKLPRPDDPQRPRSIVHLADLVSDALQMALETATKPSPPASTPTTTLAATVPMSHAVPMSGATAATASMSHDSACADYGSAAHAPIPMPMPVPPLTQRSTAPWTDTAPVTYGQEGDPLNDPATHHAFARHSHLLRQYYGFPHGSAARLALFLEAARASAMDGHEGSSRGGGRQIIDLSWFITACPLRTFVALVPVKLHTPAVVRAVMGASVRVDQVPMHVSTRLGLRRQSAHRQRFLAYVMQLEELGLAERIPRASTKHDVDHASQDNAAAAQDGSMWALVDDAPVFRWPREHVQTMSVRTPEERSQYWAAVREAVQTSEPRRVPVYLCAPHAWRDTFSLRGVQKAFLKRYVHAVPPMEGIRRLASTIFAPVDAVESFFASHHAQAHRTTATIAHKVEARRKQRADEWNAALADVQAMGPPDAAMPRALQQLEKRYVYGRDAMDASTLRKRIAAALGMQKKRVPKAAPVRRTRRRSSAIWTPAHQDLLRDAYVIVSDRQEAWRSMHIARGEHVPPDDWSALWQLIQAQPPSDATHAAHLAEQHEGPDREVWSELPTAVSATKSALAPAVAPADDASAQAAWNTWRARRKQLASSVHEQVRLSLMLRAWHGIAAHARCDGSLPDPEWPHPSAFSLPAHIAYLREHMDQKRLLQEHAEEAARVVLPLRVNAEEAAAWTPIVHRTGAAAASLPSDSAPMVHRLGAMRGRPMSMYAWAPARIPRTAEEPATHTTCHDGYASAIAKMLVPKPVDASGVAAWAERVGPERLERALARLVDDRVLVHTSTERLAYADDIRRASWPSASGWPPSTEVRDAYEHAQLHGGAHAHPAATESETAAWLALFETQNVRATLDLAPLQALRRRPKLNARTLDDVETECTVTLTVESIECARQAQALPPLPKPPCTIPTVDVPLRHDQVAQLESAGAAGLCANDLLDMDALLRYRHACTRGIHDNDQAAADGLAQVLCVGYEDVRIVHPKFIDAWCVRNLRDNQRVVPPRAWFDVYGDVHMDVWEERVTYVMTQVCTQPGVSVSALGTLVGRIVDRMELYDILHAAVETRRIAIDSELWRAEPSHAHVKPMSSTIWFQ